MAAVLRRSFRELPPTHELRITVFGLIHDGELSACLTKFLRRLGYRMKRDGFEFRYFLVNEWTEGHRHFHLLVRTDGELTSPLVRELWAKSWPGLPFTHHCATVRDAVAVAKYVVKDLKSQDKKEVPPKTFKGRICRYSRGFLTESLDAVWEKVVGEWQGSPATEKPDLVSGAKGTTRGNRYRRLRTALTTQGSLFQVRSKRNLS